MALASTCKEYAAGLAREVRRATALALPRHERDRFGHCHFGYPQGHIISFTSKAVVASANRLTREWSASQAVFWVVECQSRGALHAHIPWHTHV